MTYRDLPTLNAALNSLAAILLVVGYVLIKQRRETAHKYTMFAAFGVSVVFLVSYLTYHYAVGHVPFPGPEPIRTMYLAMLLSHVLLAAAVPVLAVGTIYHGLKDNRLKHRLWARWTFPIWLYVSITGVVIYALLYHVYPSR